jgi:hypothetical protein
MYNLDITEYTLDDLFNLFEIPLTTEIRKEHIRIAKQKVMMSHPDKSHLPPEYFIFYKKAFEMIVHYYETQNRTEQVVPIVSSKETELIYDPIHSSHNTNTNIPKNNKNFNKKFNELFEANDMISKPNIQKNEWFQKEENPFEKYAGSVKSVGQINQTLEQIKKHEKERAMALYRGVTPLNGNYSSNRLYEDDEDEINEYICSDPFSKLKYDDLRKVHKDQTVFIVSENDLGNIKTYHSVDQYSREREKDRGMVKPMEKEKAEKWFQEEERRKQERIMQKQHRSELKTMENIEKNKSVLSSFLRIL